MNSLDLSRVSLQTERNFKITPYITGGRGIKFRLWWAPDEELQKPEPLWTPIQIVTVFKTKTIDISLADKRQALAQSLIGEWVETYKPHIKAMMRQAWREGVDILSLSVSTCSTQIIKAKT